MIASVSEDVAQDASVVVVEGVQTPFVDGSHSFINSSIGAIFLRSKKSGGRGVGVISLDICIIYLYIPWLFILLSCWDDL